MESLHLVFWRDGKVAVAHRLEGLPATVGFGPEATLRLPGPGPEAPLATIERSERGVPELWYPGRARWVRLRPGVHCEIGPFTLACLDLGSERASEAILGPLLDLLDRLWTLEGTEALSRAVLETLARAFDADWAALLPAEAEGDGARVLASAGSRGPGRDAKVSRTVLAALAAGSEPFLGATIQEDPRLAGAASIPPEVTSVIAGRLLAGGRGEGIVYLESRAARRAFTRPERLLLDRVCAFLAGQMARLREAREADEERTRLAELNRRDRPREPGGEPMVGSSAALVQVRAQIGKAAAAGITTLIRGESGTGKELVARAIHESSPRADRPFVAINCAAVPPALIESELFGHAKGAFTGAVQKRVGRIELAHKGTLFLDEVGDLPLETQAKLLRVLAERTVRPLGDERDRPVDVHLVSATHLDLDAMRAAGRFRDDLYFRIAVFRIDVPPLRDRLEDLEALLAHFLALFNERHRRRIEGFDLQALEILRTHRWPGNLRELRNVIEQAVVREEGRTITPASFAIMGAPPATAQEEPMTLADGQAIWEREFMRKALVAERGDVKAVLKRLETTRSRFYLRCKAYGLDPAAFRKG